MQTIRQVLSVCITLSQQHIRLCHICKYFVAQVLWFSDVPFSVYLPMHPVTQRHLKKTEHSNKYRAKLTADLI